MSRIGDIQTALAEAALDGWLFYDFRMSDPLAYRILELPERMVTRRWFCFVPCSGLPFKLVSAVEAHRLDSLAGITTVYRSAEEMHHGLARILRGARRVAMAYSPNCAVPYVSRVDAGTIELVRSLGVEVISAADLIQRFDATLTEQQLKSHHRAAGHLLMVVDETFAERGRRVRAGSDDASEHQIQQFVIERFAAKGLTTMSPPIVATNAHSADPHYEPSERHRTEIQAGDFVLLDLWAKETAEHSIYADFTWIAFVGDSIPEEHAKIFSIVANARDAAVELVHDRVSNRQPVSGRDADRAARAVIEAAGFGERFLHRTGHSIGREVHGTGANLDSLETDEHRMLIENTCFSVEPGIYLPGRFGVRLELDMTIENGRAKISADAVQREIVPILA